MTQSQTAASIPATIGMFAAVFCPDFPSGAVGLLDRSKKLSLHSQSGAGYDNGNGFRVEGGFLCGNEI